MTFLLVLKKETKNLLTSPHFAFYNREIPSGQHHSVYYWQLIKNREFSGGARALATIQKSFVGLRRARVLMMMINHTILFFMVGVVPKRGMTTITQNQGKFHTLLQIHQHIFRI